MSRSSRREFTKATKVEIVKRATRDGTTFCERCGASVTRWEIHHTIPDAMAIDKSKPLTAADGELLCEPCHDASTHEKDVPAIAKAKRVEAAHLGIKGTLGPLAVPQAVRKARKAAQSADRSGGKIGQPSYRPLFEERR